jgi:PadR family transcriptional regulator, regulatory protein PadR
MKDDTDNRDLYSGMIRLHILHHAEQEALFGAGMAEELARHGYKISPETLYPILHGLEKRGYIKSEEERSGRSVRRFYKITASGRRAIKTAKPPGSQAFWRAH